MTLRYLEGGSTERRLEGNSTERTLEGITRTKTFTCDAILVNRNTQTFTCDGLLEATINFNFTVDALIEAEVMEFFLVDALLEQTFDETFTVDAILNKVSDFTVDSLLRDTFDGTFTVDSIVINRINKTFIVDTILSQEALNLFLIDALLEETNTFTFDIDAITYLPIYNTYTIDALLKKEKTKTFIIDAVFEQEKTKTFTVDSLLISSTQPTKLFAVDARLKQVQTETFTVQANLRYKQTKTPTVDALIKLTGEVLCSTLEPIFSDTFDSSTGWTTFGLITVDSLANPDVLRYSCVNSSNPGSQAIKTLPIPTGEEFRIEFTHNNIGGCTSFGSFASFGLTDSTTRIGHQFTAVPKLEYRVNSGDGPNGEGIRILYRSTVSDPVLISVSAIPMTDNTTYYVRIDKNLASIITLSMFSDSARTIHVSGSPITLDVSSQIKVPFTYVQASNVGPAGPGSARQYTGEIEDLIIYEDRCPNFLVDAFLKKTQEEVFNIDANLSTRFQFTCDALLKKTRTKTFTIDAFFEAEDTLETFTTDALLVRVKKFSLDALIKALGDNRCPFENIFEEHFTTTSGWSVEINNTTVDGWGTQRIFIDGESLSSQELDQFGDTNGFAYIIMPPGGFNPSDTPILKSKYRRKKLDFNGGIGRVRGNNIRLDFELTHISGTLGKWVVLNKSSLHPDNDPNTATLNVNVSASQAISVTLGDGVNSATTSSLSIGGVKRYVSIESVGNTLTLNVYSDEAHTTHIAGSPINVNTSSVNKDQLDLSWLIIGANNKSASTANPDTIGKVDNIKIFSSPCPVAYVDGYLTQSFSTTLTIDARLIKEQRFTIDAIIQGRKFFNVDAKLVRERTTIIDALLFKTRTRLFTVDPLLIGAVNKTFKIDGLPFVPPAVLIITDAIINLQDVNKTFDIDSILIKGAFHTFTVDAFIIQLTINKQFTVDSRIRETNIESFYVDALVKMLGSNGTCNFQPDPFFAIDTGLEQYIGPITPEHEESVDLLIGQEVILNNQQVRRVIVLLRASGFPNEIIEESLIIGKIWGNVVVGNPAGEIVESTSENTINAQNTSGDLPAGVWREITFIYDPLTTPFLTGNFVVGFQHFVGPNTNDPQGVGIAIPVISNSNVISGSAVMRREGNSIIDPLTWQYLTSMSKDIVIRVEVVNGDDVVEGINRRCPRVDSLLSLANTKVVTVDAHIATRKLFTLDALFDQAKPKTFIIDARLIGNPKPKVDAILITASIFTIDAVTFTPPAITFTIDALLRGAKFTIDAYIEQQNKNKIFNCNALLSVPNNLKTFSIDAKTQYFNLVAPFKVDGFVIRFPSALFFIDGIVKAFNKQKLFRVDALLEKTKTSTFLVDARVKKTGFKTFTVDAELIIKDKVVTFDITASLATTQPPILFSVGALIIKTNARYRVDSLLRLRKTKTFTADARLSSRLNKTYLTDALIKEFNVAELVIIDSIIKKQTDLQFIVDANVESTAGVVTFTINSRLVFPFKKPLVDARVVNRKIKEFTVDSFIDPPFKQKPRVDAIVKAFGINRPFTIDALIGIGQKKVTVDAKLNKIKIFTIDAMTGELIDVGVEAESVINDGSGNVGFESTMGIGGTQ